MLKTKILRCRCVLNTPITRSKPLPTKLVLGLYQSLQSSYQTPLSGALPEFYHLYYL